jgi:hypothetical protein
MDDRRRGSFHRWRVDTVGTWWFLAAGALLYLNDQVLKHRHPGWITGKVSDVVGPLVVAGLLATLVGRRPAVVLTALGFAVVKTVPGAAEAVAPVLGGTTRRDPTDLIGLVGLVPLWFTPSRARRPARRRLARPGHRPGHRRSHGGPPPGGGRAPHHLATPGAPGLRTGRGGGGPHRHVAGQPARGPVPGH